MEMTKTATKKTETMEIKMRRMLPLLAGFAMVLTALPALAAEAEGGGDVSPFAGDVGTALWALVIFGLVIFILGKYAWGPVLNVLQSRETFVRDSLEAAKRERTEAEARLAEYMEKLARAQSEAQALIDEGKRDAEATKRRILDEAREESEKIAARSRREIEIATQTALKELYSTSARLATDIAGRLIGRELTAADHERLVAESIEELGNARPTGSTGNPGTAH